MQVGTRLDFSKCSLTVENNGSLDIYKLRPHQDLGKISFRDSANIVIELLRDGLPIVHAPDRVLLANQLEKFICFCAEMTESDSDSVYSCMLRFMENRDFVEVSRTVQALMLMDDLLGRSFVSARKYHPPYQRVNFEGLIKGYRGLYFIRKPSFKKEMTAAYFREAYGEAIIPEGEHLEARFANKTIIIESGTTLRFLALRHFDSSTTQNQRGVDVYCDAVCAFEKDIAYMGLAEFEVVFDPSCFGEPNRTKVVGSVPLHWVTQRTNGPVATDRPS